MYLNGIVRSDYKNETTILQEYAVWTDEQKSKGRCDAFINNNGNAILIEAKRDFDNTIIRNNHWDIDTWLDWDEEIIGSQLLNYYLAQENYLGKDDYTSCQLMTLVFKLISVDPYEHKKNAEQNLGKKISHKFSKGWFYTFLFDDEMEKSGRSTGLEIYGTLKTMRNDLS